MKRHKLAIDKYQAASFLKAVRAKRDVIVLWMNTIKAFLAAQPAGDEEKAADLEIVVMSMSRLFCELEGGKKIFSISFPFVVKSEIVENTESVSFHSREGIIIDSRVSSQILGLIEGGEVLDSVDFGKFIDPILEASDTDPKLWALLRELMLAEDAYVRYDWDAAQANGHLHPEHHLDLYYSTGGSFKIGLERQLDQQTLVSILNIETDCHYLRPAGAAQQGGQGRQRR